MFEKQKLKEAYIEAIKYKLEKAKTSYEIAKNDTIEAEGRMVTRYDSSKTETAWLADSRLKEMKELQQYINNLRESKIYANIFDTILADLFINKEYKKTDRFFLSKIGKEKISDKHLEAFLGHIVGDVVVLEEDGQYFQYQLREIQKGDNAGTISIESVVTLSDEFKCKEIYYIVNYIGGMEIEVDGQGIFCISKHTPLAKKLLGRKKGDKVLINDETGMNMFIDEVEV